MKKQRIVKLLTSFIVLSLFFSLSMNAQEQRVTMKVRNASLKDVFKRIEKQTTYRFSYRDVLLDNRKDISMSKNDVSVSTVLDEALSGRDLDYKIISSKLIAISEKKSMMPTNQTKQKVSGVIKDENGEPVIGASITVKGRNTGTVTDLNGNYSLDVSNGDVIDVSYIGYQKQSISIGNKNRINVTLKEDSKALDEVIVVGYGTVRKSDLTGAISSVKAEDIKKSSAMSFDRALQGLAAGVNVYNNTGAPGGNVSIQIRGVNTTSGDGANEPLYVVDGMPLSNDENMGGRGYTRSGTMTSPLAGINPRDIQSIEVLKDASATAIYGARAANGVVLVTTKTGSEGKAKVTADFNYGFQNVIKKIEMCNAAEYMDLYNQSITAYNEMLPAGQPNRKYVPEFQPGNAWYEANKDLAVDWQDAMFRTAPQFDINVGVTGGNSAARYAVALGYSDQEGILVNTNNKRVTMRTNLDLNPQKWLKIGARLNLSREWGNQATTGENYQGIDGVWENVPFYKVWDDNGNYWEQPDQNYSVSNPYGPTGRNLLCKRETDKQENGRNRFLSNVFAEIKFLNDFTFKTSLGGDIQNTRQFQFTPYYRPNRNIYTESQTVTRTYNNINLLAEQLLTYSKVFDKHSISAMLGFSMQYFSSTNEFLSGKGSTDPRLDQLSNNSQSPFVWGGRSDAGLVSQFGRVNYSYANKYLLTATLRRDGSSRFGPNNKYGYFPSASVAWKVTEEPFMKNVPVISNLKLRASYGVTGNQNIGNFGYLDQVNSLTNIWGNATTVASSKSIGNPDLKWEENHQTDIGLDLGLFNQRITIEADYYYKLTKGLLVWVPLPITSGTSGQTRNMGKIENRGWEFLVTTRNLVGEFTWNTTFNISMNRNKVLDLGTDAQGNANYLYGMGLGNDASPNRTEAGQPIGAFYLQRYLGVYQNQAEIDANPFYLSNGVLVTPGTAKFLDVNKDGKINDDDRMYVGSPEPDFFGGIGNEFSYKNFTLNIFANFSVGGKIYSNFLKSLEKGDGYWNQTKWYYNHYWTPERNTDVARPAKGPANGNSYGFQSTSDRYLYDASYLRIKNISLAYRFPDKIVHSLCLSGLRVYASLDNYFTFTKYRGIDPGINSQGNNATSMGIDNFSYPLAKSMSFGFNVEF